MLAAIRLLSSILMPRVAGLMNASVRSQLATSCTFVSPESYSVTSFKVHFMESPPSGYQMGGYRGLIPRSRANHTHFFIVSRWTHQIRNRAPPRERAARQSAG